MTTSLSGKVAVVTGASSGIGAATVATLIRHGARVVASARRLDRLNELADKLAVDADSLKVVRADVCDERDAANLVETAVAWGGSLDILINNAGLSRGSVHEFAKVDDLRVMLETNVFALANITRLAIPHLKKAGGDIINISSAAAKSMIPGAATYAATKAAVGVFSESLRKEVGASGIRVVTIYPGLVDTEFFDGFEEDRKAGIDKMKSTMDILKSEDLSDVIIFALTRPPYVSLNEIVIRPTKMM